MVRTPRTTRPSILLRPRRNHDAGLPDAAVVGLLRETFVPIVAPTVPIFHLRLAQVIQGLSVLPAIQRQDVDAREGGGFASRERVLATHEASDAAGRTECVRHILGVEAISAQARFSAGRTQHGELVRDRQEHAGLVAVSAVALGENRICGRVRLAQVQSAAVGKEATVTRASVYGIGRLSLG